MKQSALKVAVSLLALAVILLTSSFRLVESYGDRIRLFSNKIGSIGAASSYKEFIVKVNELNDKNLSVVRNAIEGGGNIIFKGFCPKLQVLMYLINREEYPDNSFLNKLTTLSFTYEIKDGSSILDVSNACGIVPANDSNTQTE
jgi:hypothetical protein